MSIVNIKLSNPFHMTLRDPYQYQKVEVYR